MFGPACASDAGRDVWQAQIPVYSALSDGIHGHRPDPAGVTHGLGGDR